MAGSEQTLETQRVRSIARPGRRAARLVLFVLAVTLGIGAVVGGLAAYHDRLNGRILPGVSVAGVDLGDMTPDQARAALSTALSGYATGGITIRSSIGRTTLAFADVGRVADIDGILAEALGRGRGGTWFDEVISAIRLRVQPETVTLRLGYDPAATATAIHAFAARMALAPIDATVVSGPAGYAVTPSLDGSRIDETAAVAAIDRAMADPATRAGAVVDVGLARSAASLTTDAATQAVASAGRIVAPVTIKAGTRTWTIKAAQIRPWLSFGWVDGRFRPIIDRTKIPAALKSIATKVLRPVRNAELLRDRHGRIIGSKADRAGRALDVAATSEAIALALEARVDVPAATPVKLAMMTVAPTMTTAEAAKAAPLMVMVGSWTTHYQVMAHNGFGANITVPTRVLNGTVVAPGAVFDFWAGLGEVSLRTGYKLGGAIVGGHSVEGKALAGGICAASTTLFNAALRGGFEILARQPHWYYITRYPLGLDATVSGAQTMKFRNDTRYPILIRGFASPGFVRYEIWSVPNGRTVTLSRPQVTNVVAGSDSTVKTTSLPAGQTLRTEWPVDGKDVVVTRTVRDANGRIIHQDTFVSHYHRMIGILQIGIG